MRRVVAFLVAAVMLATSSAALPPGCPVGTRALSGLHACCEGHGAMPRSSDCCAAARDRLQQGPTEAFADAPAVIAGAVASHAVARHASRARATRAPSPAPVALYLRQHALLI